MENTARPQPELLRRHTHDGQIAGVAAGLGDYFNIDPVLVRLTFILLLFVGGFGLLVYLLAWLVIPPADETQPLAPRLEHRLPRTRRNVRSIVGGLALAVGVIAFLATAGAWWIPRIEAFPLILIALGAGLLLLRARRDDGGPPTAIGEQPVEPAPADESPPTEPEPASDEPPDDTLSNGEPADDAPGVESTTRVEAVTGDPVTSEPAGPLQRTRRRAPVAWVTIGAIVLAGALAALLDVVGAVDVSAQAFLLVALALVGLGVIGSAFLGRRLAIVGLAGLVAVGLAVASLPGSISLASGAGERTVRPASLAELEERYELGAGKLTLDLRELDPPVGHTTIEADVGIGELVVLFPVDAEVWVAGHAAVGEVELFGRSDSGVSVDRGASRGDHFPAPPGLGTPTRVALIVVDAEIGIGRLEARVAA